MKLPAIKRVPGTPAALVFAAAIGLPGVMAAQPGQGAPVAVGAPAPQFTLKSLDGKDVSLSQFSGRTVVLEWHNPNCPFVAKHYDSGNLPGMHKRYAPSPVTWIAVNSTHPGHADFMDNKGLAAYNRDKGAAPSAYLVDPQGQVGRQYGARTTPHMYVIDPAGRLVYAGAIDSIRSSSPADIGKAKNHVAAALEDLKAGRPVAESSTTPYGCSVKYQ